MTALDRDASSTILEAGRALPSDLRDNFFDFVLGELQSIHAPTSEDVQRAVHAAHKRIRKPEVDA